MIKLYNSMIQTLDTLALASERAVWCTCGGRQFSQAAKPIPLTFIGQWTFVKQWVCTGRRMNGEVWGKRKQRRMRVMTHGWRWIGILRDCHSKNNSHLHGLNRLKPRTWRTWEKVRVACTTVCQMWSPVYTLRRLQRDTGCVVLTRFLLSPRSLRHIHWKARTGSFLTKHTLQLNAQDLENRRRQECNFLHSGQTFASTLTLPKPPNKEQNVLNTPPPHSKPPFTYPSKCVSFNLLP